MPKQWTRAALAKTIDHTALKAITTEQQVRELCAEAKANGFASVCVNPYWVPLCAKELSSSKVMVCTVVGFPLGANPTEIKAAEASWAVKQGAQEVDMVINIGAAKSGDWKTVEHDIREVVKASANATVKVIIETCYLTDDEKVKACELSKKAGAQFVKTSTGFGTSGATADDVALMKKTVGPDIQVKASGGVRTYHDAIKMLEAGADRIGASSGVSIISELPE
jgi:deoxyribose-phosphate aldolase